MMKPIYWARVRVQISQADAARSIGCSRKLLDSIEYGLVDMFMLSEHQLEELAKLYKTDPSSLYDGAAPTRARPPFASKSLPDPSLTWLLRATTRRGLRDQGRDPPRRLRQRGRANAPRRALDKSAAVVKIANWIARSSEENARLPPSSFLIWGARWCAYCGASIQEYDPDLRATVNHIVSIAAGGNDGHNRVIVCNQCNQDKRTTSLLEFISRCRLMWRSTPNTDNGG